MVHQGDIKLRVSVCVYVCVCANAERKRLTSGCYYQQKLSWEKCRGPSCITESPVVSPFNTSGRHSLFFLFYFYLFFFSQLQWPLSGGRCRGWGTCPFNFANVVNRVNQTTKFALALSIYKQCVCVCVCSFVLNASIILEPV